MRRWTTGSEAETEEVGRSLAVDLAPDGLLLLDGDLGSGKTVLTKGVAGGLGIDPLQVQSPTFTIIREHQGVGGRLIHVDLYRLEPQQAAGIGLEESLAGSGVKVVEWAERLEIPVVGALRLQLKRTGNPHERIIVEIGNPEG